MYFSLSTIGVVTVSYTHLDNANIGTQTGAFYCYPSLQEDGGALLLKGRYKVNETETKEVSYRIPFRRQGVDGQETYLDINNNHRYTIGITAVSYTHLDVYKRQAYPPGSTALTERV